MGRRIRWRQAAGPIVCAVLLAALLGACASQSTPPTTGRTPTSTPHPTPTATPQASYTQLVPPPPVSATAYLVMNPHTGTIYLAHDAQSELPMASTTKIMTALVALTFGKLNQPITVHGDATALQGTGASVAGLRIGDTLTLHELLYALLLPSGDDAAVVIADGVAGSQSRFVALMNAQAALLGLRHTHYANVHGLDAPGHYTTARDLARLAAIAMGNSTFAQVVGTSIYALAPTSAHGGYTWHTTNELLTSRFYAGVTGVKTGFTGNAGDCLVFSASRPYGDLIGVELGEPGDYARFSDARALLDWGFTVEYAAALVNAHGSG